MSQSTSSFKQGQRAATVAAPCMTTRALPACGGSGHRLRPAVAATSFHSKGLRQRKPIVCESGGNN